MPGSQAHGCPRQGSEPGVVTSMGNSSPVLKLPSELMRRRAAAGSPDGGAEGAGHCSLTPTYSGPAAESGHANETAAPHAGLLSLADAAQYAGRNTVGGTMLSPAGQSLGPSHAPCKIVGTGVGGAMEAHQGFLVSCAWGQIIQRTVGIG